MGRSFRYKFFEETHLLNCQSRCMFQLSDHLQQFPAVTRWLVTLLNTLLAKLFPYHIDQLLSLLTCKPFVSALCDQWHQIGSSLRHKPPEKLSCIGCQHCDSLL